MAPNHLSICVSKLQVHVELKVRINVVRRAKKLKKICQKWLKNCQTMAIFSHKWPMLWRKKHEFINLSNQPSEYLLTIYRYAIIVSFSKYR